LRTKSRLPNLPSRFQVVCACQFRQPRRADMLSANGITAMLRFRDTLVPLAIAPLTGLIAILIFLAWNIPAREILFVALLLSAYVYGTVGVFALPILIFWPRTRRPSLVVGTLWGIAGVAGAYVAVVIAASLRDRQWLSVFTPDVFGFLVPFWIAGGLSGLTYSLLVRRRTGADWKSDVRRSSSAD
jgi:hypothetical protein